MAQSRRTTESRLDLLMNVSLATGFVLLAVKLYATVVTGSAALMSDAAESVVHVVAVSFAAWSLRQARKPLSKTHPFGYDKITFFSAGFEGAMIVFAALYILFEATKKILAGPDLQQIGLGTTISALVVVVNGLLGWALISAGRKHGSLIVEANGRHVLTDSITSLAVLAGLLLCLFGKNPWFSSLYFDPVFAIIAALNISREGVSLMARSFQGLMDTLPAEEEAEMEEELQGFCLAEGVIMHEFRVRNSGNRYWIQFHLIFDDGALLLGAHEAATRIELKLVAAYPGSVVTTHLETKTNHEEAHKNLPTAHLG